jgi:hypothetical protein
MNRPSSLACLAGKPRVCVLLLVLYTAMVWAWFNGAVPWWMALLAVGAAQRTLRSYHELKRYTAWRVQWEAMGPPPNDRPAPPPHAPAAAHKGFVAVAVLVAVGVPFYGTGGSDGVLGVWLAACMILVVELVRAVRRRSHNSGAKMPRPAKAHAADNSQVAWALGRASSAPTRTDAERNLPDYCARLGG